MRHSDLPVLEKRETCDAAPRGKTGSYLQFGCGWSAPAEWLNFDSSPTLRFERLPIIGRVYTKNRSRFPENVIYGDIVEGLAVADASCHGVYASHVLEHLSREDFENALAETHRILAPDGIFRLIVPDLETAAREYLASLRTAHATANDNFMRATSLGRERRSKSFGALLKSWLGGSDHLWMWDYASLADCLSAHGFDRIRRAGFNDCEDPRFREVEERDRFRNAVAVEARKPSSP